MKHLQNILPALFIWGVAATGNSFAHVPPEAADTIVTFRFQPGEDLFMLEPNDVELPRLYGLIEEYRLPITSGEIPVCVDGYCASLPTVKENLNTAFVRANRVKSELITHKGLKEMDFITANYARACYGMKDVVVVTLRIPLRAGVLPEPAKQDVAEQHLSETRFAEGPEPESESGRQAEPTVPEPAISVTPDSAPMVSQSETYRFALRTNLLYDAMLLPTLGVEWRVNRDWGIKLDGSLGWWGGHSDKVQKIWLLNPEVRWYLLRDRRFYVGASGSYGEYNIYRYPLGRLFSKDTGYQGTLWSAGATVGYRLCLSRRFSVDFNLGLGYARSRYDSFGMTDGVRVTKERDRSKNFFGPTQAGISLVWTLGNNK